MTITKQDLEDAAKAAGFRHKDSPSDGTHWVTLDGAIMWHEWNPEHNKADLWDLAEKCEMQIDFCNGEIVFSATILHPAQPHRIRRSRDLGSGGNLESEEMNELKVAIVLTSIVMFGFGWMGHGLSIKEDCKKLGGVVIGGAVLICEVKK